MRIDFRAELGQTQGNPCGERLLEGYRDHAMRIASRGLQTDADESLLYLVGYLLRDEVVRKGLEKAVRGGRL